MFYGLLLYDIVTKLWLIIRCLTEIYASFIYDSYMNSYLNHHAIVGRVSDNHVSSMVDKIITKKLSDGKTKIKLMKIIANTIQYSLLLRSCLNTTCVAFATETTSRSYEQTNGPRYTWQV